MMPPSMNPSNNITFYPINTDQVAELDRLLMLDHSLTTILGELLPPGLQLLSGQLVLDVACGPGGWSIEVARAYPDVDVIGIDINQKMIRYANAQARTYQLHNINFQVMNALEPLIFPDDTFDMVNARLVSPFVPALFWPTFVQECARVVRPGGVLRITDYEWISCNGQATESYMEMIKKSMWHASLAFAPDALGVIARLEGFLQVAGLVDLHSIDRVLAYTCTTPSYELWRQNFMIGASLMLPFFLKLHVTTEEDFEQVYQQMDIEMREPNFYAHMPLLSAWGFKP